MNTTTEIIDHWLLHHRPMASGGELVTAVAQFIRMQLTERTTHYPETFRTSAPDEIAKFNAWKIGHLGWGNATTDAIGKTVQELFDEHRQRWQSLDIESVPAVLKILWHGFDRQFRPDGNFGYALPGYRAEWPEVEVLLFVASPWLWADKDELTYTPYRLLPPVPTSETTYAGPRVTLQHLPANVRARALI
jgi:hypothetical protein